MSDAVLREAARLLRQGAPVEAFVGALDDSSRAALSRAISGVGQELDTPCCLCGKREAWADTTNAPICCCGDCFGRQHKRPGEAFDRHGAIDRFQGLCADCPHRVPS